MIKSMTGFGSGEFKSRAEGRMAESDAIEPVWRDGFFFAESCREKRPVSDRAPASAFERMIPSHRGNASRIHLARRFALGGGRCWGNRRFLPSG